MLTTHHTRNRQELQQKLEQAHHEVMQVLTAEASAFGSSAQMRETLNRARDMRRWAAEQIARLEQANLH